jgi:predicted nucleotidyltransferase
MINWFLLKVMILKENQLQETILRIKQRINPEAIYLFGSQVSGKASEESGDVDLCIIVTDEKEPYHEAVEAYESLQDMPFPKDLVVRRRSRFEKRAAWPSSLEHEIANSGRLIYPA